MCIQMDTQDDPIQYYHPFDCDLVLPEYFVEYTVENENSGLLPEMPSLGQDTLAIEKGLVESMMACHFTLAHFPNLVMEAIPMSALPKNETEASLLYYLF